MMRTSVKKSHLFFSDEPTLSVLIDKHFNLPLHTSPNSPPPINDSILMSNGDISCANFWIASAGTSYI
jgi:hypothetical protein